MALQQSVSMSLRHFATLWRWNLYLHSICSSVISICLQQFEVPMFQFHRGRYTLACDSCSIWTSPLVQVGKKWQGSFKKMRSNLPFTFLRHVWVGTFSILPVLFAFCSSNAVEQLLLMWWLGFETKLSIKHTHTHMFAKRGVFLVWQPRFADVCGVSSSSFQVQARDETCCFNYCLCGFNDERWRHVLGKMNLAKTVQPFPYASSSFPEKIRE